MLKAFSKLWNNERGNMVVIAAAALPMLVGAAGLATDTIQWALWKRQIQRAADSAAIAGVYDRALSAGASAGPRRDDGNRDRDHPRPHAQPADRYRAAARLSRRGLSGGYGDEQDAGF